ncbi:MAG: protein kinase domain-containing protein [Polyangiales bacterium]
MGAPARPSGAPKPIPFGKYLLLDRLAVGGMAEVYLARAFGVAGFARFLAIKRILPNMAEDRDFITMFIDEAKIAGHLNHANIAPIFELGKIGSAHYIAMEYVWGKDLLQIINRLRKLRRRMLPQMVAWVASRICAGLSYAHSKQDRQGRQLNLIHRDVSPQNILVSYEGEVKLIDFGIAKAASRSTQTEAGVLKGKFGYMSPEQVRGREVDHRSDIFALGTCMYEMLTCDRLFLGDSDLSTLEKVRMAAVPPPSQIVPHVSPAMDHIVLKALAREPDDRYATAAELQEDLQAFGTRQAHPFGTTELAEWMRSAFDQEIATEQGRLRQFAKVPGPEALAAREEEVAPPRLSMLGATQAADIMQPALAATKEMDADLASSPAAAKAPVPSPGLCFDDHTEVVEQAEMTQDATAVVASPFDVQQEQRLSQIGSVLDESETEIFFSAFDTPPPMPPARVQAMLPEPPAPNQQPPAALQATPSGPPLPTESSPKTRAATPTGGTGAASRSSEHRRSQTAPVMALPALTGRLWRGGWLILALACACALAGAALATRYAARQQTSTLEVRTVPAIGATVEIDGIPRGRAPLRMAGLTPGERMISVHADGYHQAVRRVRIERGVTAVFEIALLPLPLPLHEHPSQSPKDDATHNADATSGDKNAATSPARTRKQTDGHTASPRSAGKIQMPPHHGSENTAALGALSIHTTPAARVFVDGKDTGLLTPLSSFELSAGLHRIGLRTPDGRMHHLQVRVQAGRTVRIARRY